MLVLCGRVGRVGRARLHHIGGDHDHGIDANDGEQALIIRRSKLFVVFSLLLTWL